MLSVYLTLLIIFAVFLLNKLWIYPRKMMKNYVEQVKKLGYSVKLVPYHPLFYDMAVNFFTGMAQGDAMKVYRQDLGKYDVVVTNILLRPKVQLNHPDFIKDFHAVNRHLSMIKQQYVMDIYRRVIRTGLALSEGNAWKKKRSIFNKVFNFDFVKSQCLKIAQICQDAIIQQQKNAKFDNTEQCIIYNVNDLTTKMFSNIIMEIFLGGTKNLVINGQPAGHFIKTSMDQASLQTYQFINILLGPKFLNMGLTKKHRQVNERIRIFNKWGNQFLAKRIEQINKKLQSSGSTSQPQDILQALLIEKRKFSNQKQSDQAKITDQWIFQQFSTFFVAGTDTTSNYTTMLLYQIARNPLIQVKVRQQIKKYMSTDDYSFDNLKNLKYIQLLQKQTARCHIPAPLLFPRYTNIDNNINGLQLKKGTAVSISSYGNHFSQKYFKDPYQFRPERWQNQCDNIPPFVVGGFSAGPRTCIGKHLAMMQSKIALVKFMKRYTKIVLPSNKFKMVFKFLYGAEDFQSKMYMNPTESSANGIGNSFRESKATNNLKLD